jgi:nucleoside-triphosphatase
MVSIYLFAILAPILKSNYIKLRTKKNILITGPPGVGKTTLMKKLAQKLKDFRPAGFYTDEIREVGVRHGFELAGFNGRKGLLSHIDIKSQYRVGRYGVDIRGLEVFLDALALTDPNAGLVMIDEIGKMECLSQRFKSVVRTVLDSGKVVIATIALKGSGFIAEVKGRDDVMLFEMTLKNRDSLAEEILRHVKTSYD